MNNGTGTDDKLSATLTGMAVSAAMHVIRTGNDAADRLDRNRDDIDALRARLREMETNGHWIRDSSAPVADVLGGVALAREEETTPSLLPSIQKFSRPDLLSALQASIGDFTWPPRGGEYNDAGYIKKAGELVSLGLILTYEEVRAFLHGLVLNSQPDKEVKVTIFNSASALIAAIAKRKTWTWAAWTATWERLFGGQPHLTVPSISGIAAQIAAPSLGTGSKDHGLVAKITINANLNAGSQVAKITFGTPFTNPPVVVAGGPWETASVTEKDFILVNRVAFIQGDVLQVPVVVGSTDG